MYDAENFNDLAFNPVGEKKGVPGTTSSRV
jgi:hypothetical protein